MSSAVPADDRRWVSRTFVVATWLGLAAGLTDVTLFGVKRLIQHRFIHMSRDIIWMSPLTAVAFGLIAASAVVLLGLRWRAMRSLQVSVTATAFPAVLTVLLHYQPIHILAKLILALGLSVVVGRLAARKPTVLAALVGLTSGSFRRRAGNGGNMAGAASEPEPAGEPRSSGRPIPDDSDGPGDLAAIDRRRFVVGVATALGGLVLGTRGVLRLGEWRRMRALGPAPTGVRNVVLIVLDTVRAASLSLHGYERRTTPELERWMQRGVVFENAFSTAPWTLPSHASMFTGLWHHEMSADWDEPLERTPPTLPEFLAGRGYATAGFTANPAYTTWESGLDRGFVRYDDYPRTLSQILGSSSLGSLIGCGTRNEIGCRLRGPLGWHELLGRKPAAVVRRDFSQWMGTLPADRPFFAFLNLFDAHTPYLPPAPFDTLFAPASERGNPMHLDLPGWEWTADQVQAERNAYDGAIAYLDAQVGALLDDLDARGILDDTLVIITSDHGEEFGEHGVMTHGNSLYIPALHVPLLMLGGGVPEGLRLDAAVSVRDLAATVCDLAGLEQAPFQGGRLAAHWRPGDVQPEPLFAQVSGRTFRPADYPVSKGDMHSVIAGRHHYIRRGDGVTELYDLDVDPRETTDLSGRDSAMTDSLRTLIERIPDAGE